LDLTTILWIILSISCPVLALIFLRMYRKDHDVKKLMISIGFFLNIFTYLYIILGLHRGVTTDSHLLGLYIWSPTPLIYALFFSILDRLLHFEKKIKMLLSLYFIIISISLLIFISGLMTDALYTSYMLVLSCLVLISATLLIIKARDISSVLFLLSQIFFTISGFCLGCITEGSLDISEFFPIMSFFVAYFFLYLIFIIPENVSSQTGTKSIFSIQQQLAESEKQRKEIYARYSALFNSHSDLIYIYDFKGNFIDANNAALEFTGYSKDEITSLNFKDFLDKGQLFKAFHLVREIKKTGSQLKPEEFRIIRKDGKIIDVDVMSTLIYKDGKPFAIQGIARDISDRKQAEREILREKTFSDSLLSSLPGVFYFFDATGHFIRWNKNFETVTGYSADELNTLTPKDLFDTQEKDLIQNRFNDVFTKGYGFIEASFLSKTGEKTPYYLTGYHVIIDEKDYVIGTGIDLTDLKQTQAELQKAHDTLRDMNKDLEEKVIDRTKKITYLLKQKDEFIGQLGHDLKNPLGPLINLLPVLEKKAADERDKEIFKVLIRNVRYMKNLVAKTLDLAQLNSPNTRFNISSLSLKNEIDTILENNFLLFQDKNIDVINTVSDDMCIAADKLRLEELLTNLFNNAVKYSHESGKIIINAEQKNNEIQLAVQDTGIGMTNEQLEHLFDEFYKADESRHDFESSGLGLSIAKRIVEKHGGRIWAESQGLEKGSIFYFTLPVDAKKPVTSNDIANKTDDTDIHQKIDSLLKN